VAEAEHERAVKEAERTGEKLRVLIGKLGTQQHPRGRILTAYRQARRALNGTDGSLMAVAEVLAELRTTLQTVAQDTLWEASRQGAEQAQEQIQLYGLPLGLDGYAPQTELASWMATVDAQMAAVRGLAASSGDLSAIVGDDNRVGMLSPAPVIREGARWLAIAALTGLTVTTASALDRSGAREEFGKQAVAAIDERTTNCCLQVNGQVQPVNGKFNLTGTPRYADQLSEPPFHWYCRTATALVRVEHKNDALSRAMRQAAIDELNARGVDDVRVEIHPASSTSKR